MLRLYFLRNESLREKCRNVGERRSKPFGRDDSVYLPSLIPVVLRISVELAFCYSHLQPCC